MKQNYQASKGKILPGMLRRHLAIEERRKCIRQHMNQWGGKNNTSSKTFDYQDSYIIERLSLKISCKHDGHWHTHHAGHKDCEDGDHFQMCCSDTVAAHGSLSHVRHTLHHGVREEIGLRVFCREMNGDVFL